MDADPPLVIDNDENMPDPPILEAEEAAPQSRPQGISKRPLVWRKLNLIILSFPGPRSYKFMGYVQEGK